MVQGNRSLEVHCKAIDVFDFTLVLTILHDVRHDPAAEDAILMKAPTKDHIKRFNKK